MYMAISMFLQAFTMLFFSIIVLNAKHKFQSNVLLIEEMSVVLFILFTELLWIINKIKDFVSS